MKINLMEATRILENLQKNIEKMNQVAETLESETAVTISMERLENLAVPLRHALSEIREETQAMKQMALALEQVCKIVDQCENRIIDEIENERIVFERFKVTKIHIPDIRIEQDPLQITW